MPSDMRADTLYYIQIQDMKTRTWDKPNKVYYSPVRTIILYFHASLNLVKNVSTFYRDENKDLKKIVYEQINHFEVREVFKYKIFCSLSLLLNLLISTVTYVIVNLWAF